MYIFVVSKYSDHDQAFYVYGVYDNLPEAKECDKVTWREEALGEYKSIPIGYKIETFKINEIKG